MVLEGVGRLQGFQGEDEMKRKYPQTDYLMCKKCKGTAWEIRWVTESCDDKISKAFCHDGFGYEIDTSIIKCLGCGVESPFEDEVFLELRPQEKK